MATYSRILACKVPRAEETLDPPCEEIILFYYMALDAYELNYNPYLQITM